MDRLTSGPSGPLTYGDSTHLDAVTAINSTGGYSASYDAAGNMTCRLLGGGTGTCSVRQNVAQGLTYDNEGRLVKWVDNVGYPNVTQTMAYDGEGHHVALSITGSTTYTTYYLGNLEETVAGSSGLPTVERQGSTGLLYLASDGLGSVSEALDGSGTKNDTPDAGTQQRYSLSILIQPFLRAWTTAAVRSLTESFLRIEVM